MKEKLYKKLAKEGYIYKYLFILYIYKLLTCATQVEESSVCVYIYMNTDVN